MAGHNQSDSINKKYEEVISRWQKLLSDSNNRKQRLLQVQEQFRQIEELYLTFAKKASAFNSWFENSCSTLYVYWSHDFPIRYQFDLVSLLVSGLFNIKLWGYRL